MWNEVSCLMKQCNVWVQGWHSDDNNHLPPMWPWFNTRLGVMCGLSLLVLYSALRGFSWVL